MKKIFTLAVLLFASAVAFAQWQPFNPNGLVYRDTIGRTIIITPNWLQVGMQWVEHVTLYDSIGHPVAEWRYLTLKDSDEHLAYRKIWDHITKVKGWVRFGKVDIPTKPKEED